MLNKILYIIMVKVVVNVLVGKALYSFIKVSTLKILTLGKLSFKGLCLVSGSADIRAHGNKARILFGNKVDIRENCLINASNGTIIIEEGVFINRNGIIVSMDSIHIGEHTAIGPNVVIYDHDHDYKNVKKEKYKCAPIKIGKNVWIGANCTILKGVTIGDCSVIAAGSVVTSDVPPSSILYQKRDSVMKSIVQ